MSWLGEPRQVQPATSLEYLDAERQLLGERLLALTPAQLELPSNLPGWSVRDVGVHITRVCDSIQLAVQRATVGDQTPAFGAAAKPREDMIRAMPVAGWVNLQRDACEQVNAVVADLSAAQLEAMRFPHPVGQRSIRWFCTQLLTEVAFHRWDLDRSLGGQAPLDDELAAYLLVFLLDPAEPLFGLKRAEGEAQTFSVATHRAGWVLTTTPAGTRVAPASRREPAKPVIRAAPGWLALAVYGRVRPDPPVFEIDGPPDTADRFAAIFGPTV